MNRKITKVGMVAMVAAILGLVGSAALAGPIGFDTTVTGTRTTIQIGSAVITDGAPSGAYGQTIGDFDLKLYGPGNTPRTIDNGATVTMSFDARFDNLSSNFHMAIAFPDADWDKPQIQLIWFQPGDAVNDGNWHNYSTTFTLDTTRAGAGADEFNTHDWMLLSAHQPNDPFTFEFDNFSLTSSEGPHWPAAMNIDCDNGDPTGATTAGQTLTGGYGTNSGQPFIVIAPPPGEAYIPEPATLVLVGLGGIALLRRRRRA